MAEPFIGQITVYPYTFPPRGWMDCAGQLLPISQNTALFSLLGTNYGGNGTSTFGLPDLRGRLPVSQGQSGGGSSYVLGEMAGDENVTLNTSTMPAHTHPMNANSANATTNNPSGMLLATAQIGGGRAPASDKGFIYNPARPDTTLAPGSVGPVGGSQPHNNIQPSLVLRYCIAINGIFPMRP